MIIYKITDRVKPAPLPAPWVAPVSHLPQAHGAEIYKEIRRKDDIIKKLVKDFKHKVGDKVEPASEEAKAKWGTCEVIGICTDYIYLEKDFKWPKNDNPMIVTAASETGEIFWATTNYFKE